MGIESTVSKLIKESFPEATEAELAHATITALSLIETKDIGKFKGGLSKFKQQAIDKAAKMIKPATARRKYERTAAKRLDKRIKELERHMITLLNKFSNKKLSKTMFRKKMKSELRIAYTDVYNIGTYASGLVRGNKSLSNNIGVDEKRWINSVFKQEQVHFNKFLSAVIKGESKTKSLNRIKAYATSVRSVYDASRVLQLPDNIVIYWVLESDNPCPECRLLHRMSPYTKDTLPTTPKGGATRCLSNCQCRLRVVIKPKSEVSKVKKRNKSPERMLNLLRLSRKNKAT